MEQKSEMRLKPSSSRVSEYGQLPETSVALLPLSQMNFGAVVPKILCILRTPDSIKWLGRARFTFALFGYRNTVPLEPDVDPVSEVDHQVHQNISLVLDRHCPFLRHLHRYQIQLLQKGIIADKNALGFSGFTEMGVEILNGVGGIDDSPDLLGVLEHGSQLVQMLPP